MSAIERIRESARRDAKRYSEAKMNYGRGAGNRRKILWAELQEKLKDDVYKAEFEKTVASINQRDVARKIENRKGVERAIDGAKKTVRAVKQAEGIYYRNKSLFDGLGRFVKELLFK